MSQDQQYGQSAPQGNQGPVFNPALGPAAAPVHMPAPVHQQQQSGGPAYNPYAAPQAPAPVPEYNPYGQPQTSPYAAPPQHTPYSQAPQQQQPQGGNPFAAPAYNFAPSYGPSQPAQPTPDVYPFQPTPPPPGFGAAPVQQGQPQQQPQAPQPATQPAAPAPTSFSTEQIQEIFPDDTSRAIFTGINALASANQVDLLQAFETAYQTKNPQHINERYLAQFDPNVVAQLKGQFQALVGVEQQRTQQTVQTVHQLAGGEPQWKAAVSVFNQACPKEQQAVISELFNSGDPAKVQFAAQQVLSFAAQSGSVIQRAPNGIANPGAGGGNAQMLTKDQFYQQLDYLAKAHAPGTPEYNQHYSALLEQRKLAKSYGY